MSETAASLESLDIAARRSAHRVALDWLMDRINYERSPVIPYLERQLKLDRMRQLLTRLGQPDAGMKIIHVAGTKGKGSTSAMVAGMLTAAGFRTGVFSSPHLERIEERFAVDGRRCTGEELVALVERVKPIVRAMDEEAVAEGDPLDGPTYFEITTAIALLYFVEQRVDAAVLEVGLGGRLDSTNVCLPAVSVITNISLDHMKQLGSTLAAIAREKAGIIKPGVPVVCGVVDSEAQGVIANIALEHGCRLIQAGVDFKYTYHQASDEHGLRIADCGVNRGGVATLDFNYCLPGQESGLSGLSLAMLGQHQAANAAVALATIAELRHQGWSVSEEAMRLGLSEAVLPGRVEFLPGKPAVVLDTAHNPASARALVAALDELTGYSRRTLIVSISRDKDVHAIVRELLPHFGRFIVTQYRENPRAVPAEQLARLVRQATEESRSSAGGWIAIDLAIASNPLDAWRLALRDAMANELICIAGSFFLTAELRSVVLAPRAIT